MSKRRRNRGPSILVDPANGQLLAALAAWGKCPDANDWGPVETMLLATWRDIEIGWPQGAHSEMFSIFRIADSSVVTEEELSGREALALDWRYFQVDAGAGSTPLTASPTTPR